MRYQRKYYERRLGSAEAGNIWREGLERRYLAGADFVESDESKGLTHHGAGEIFLCEGEGDGEGGEEELGEED
jgi:hypothetical protein